MLLDLPWKKQRINHRWPCSQDQLQFHLPGFGALCVFGLRDARQRRKGEDLIRNQLLATNSKESSRIPKESSSRKKRKTISRLAGFKKFKGSPKSIKSWYQRTPSDERESKTFRRIPRLPDGISIDLHTKNLKNDTLESSNHHQASQKHTESSQSQKKINPSKLQRIVKNLWESWGVYLHTIPAIK